MRGISALQHALSVNEQAHLVRKHWSWNDVANGIDVGYAGPELPIYNHPAPVVCLDALAAC